MTGPVGVVVPTHDRPQLLRETLDSVLAQDTDAGLDVVVVFDRAEPEPRLAQLSSPGRRVRVMANSRTPGLAGARNTGVLALDTELVAFSDDDDTWLPGKLTAQLARAATEPDADLVTTAITVVFDGTETARLAGTGSVTYGDLLRSRMAMLHSSTFLLRRSALLGGLGLVDEAIPGSQNEDWDLLLRAAARHPVVHVDQPLVRVRWGASSHFSRQWQTRVDSLEWMLDRHSALRTAGAGTARVYGQLAFGHAALGHRRDAARWAARATRVNWREPRSVVALAVASGAVPAETVMTTLHRRGRGL
ncbi:Glycosyl transferase family 2 [Modestobacter sp. DSM 44400]|uniref:glycosyltransferase family 2 protein n=1 Tax=Modestobacter sp. DSM 44400 TaxID=1550230 RepID=UPI0008950873|nr:glycosyltransferase family 2 protein [Modestobacter sp. DSM 44400]SDX86432.1 Glycosyl transferase family 2 [Modestobacter sp. DSM 44400]